nr:type II toxin-antitoxin system VapC family toxin [Candidatus Baldrarchaeota archaeon]
MEVQGARRVILDTDVLIKLIKEKRLSQIFEYIEPHISFITLYEYLRGLKYLNKNLEKEKEKIEESLTILWINNEILIKMSEIWFKLRKKGTTIDERDLLIGTTAIAYNLPLWTLNKRHFARLEKYGLKFYKSTR